MIVKFLQDQEVEGRLYLAGQSHEFDAETGSLLVSDGVAEEDMSYPVEEFTLDQVPVKTPAKPTSKHTSSKPKPAKADR